MAKKIDNTNTDTNTDTLELAASSTTMAWRTVVPDTSAADSIQIKESANNLLLGTRKLKVQVEIGLGRDQTTLNILDTLPVTLSKTFDGQQVASETIQLPVLQLLTVASNGLFELVNTNPKTVEQFAALMTAFRNGYFYPSSYEASIKRPPFSMAKFIGELNTDAELTEPAASQYRAAKVKYPKVGELSAFLALAYDSPKWTWLRERMNTAGYAPVAEIEDDADLL